MPALEKFKSVIERAPLGVFRSTTQDYKLIPASIDPVVIPDKLWSEVQHDAGLILSALQKVALWLRRSGNQSLFVNLSPLEKEPADFGGLATARLDLFFDGDDLLVIEANTTIPAMQAYSDMIQSAYREAFGTPGVQDPRSNTNDLLTSLLQHYERSGGSKARPGIAIVARPGDSQVAELLWLQERWRNKGYETSLVFPEDIEIRQGQLWSKSQSIDLVYRHIFAHRLKPGSAFAEACLKSDTFRVFNPISAHLEAKGVLAELSRFAGDDELSGFVQLTGDERRATLRRVVWSRVLNEDLAEWVVEHRDSLVVKSSLGYGGSGVFIGESFDEVAAQERAIRVLGVEGTISWKDFISALILRGDGQWIVQKKILGRKMRLRFLVDGTWVERESFVDCSIFTNSGVAYKPSGGACRFSSDAIVNIGQGGGLAPLLLESECD